MKSLVAVTVFCVTALWCHSSDAYIYGYTRLFHPVHGITVDLLYDCHIPNSLTVHQMMLYPLSVIKENLHPTEKRFLGALQAIDVSEDGNDTSLIWELGSPDSDFIALPKDSVLMGFGAVVERTLSHIEFIRGDIQRRELNDVCVFQDALAQSSLFDPTRYIPQDYDFLLKRYGNDAAREFERRITAKNDYFRGCTS